MQTNSRSSKMRVKNTPEFFLSVFCDTPKNEEKKEDIFLPWVYSHLAQITFSSAQSIIPLYIFPFMIPYLG